MSRRAERRERRQNRREQRRKNRRAGLRGGERTDTEEWDRYKMTQRLVSIGDDYVVENQAGVPVFEVDGSALRLRETLKMTDLGTGDQYRIQERVARARETMTVEKNGERAATVHKAAVSPIRDRFSVSVPGMPNILVVGNVLDYEYRMVRDGERIAEISKDWFRLRDSYGIEVAPETDTGLLIACTVALDMMVKPKR